MASFFAGVKNLFFGAKDESQQEQEQQQQGHQQQQQAAPGSAHQAPHRGIGHKRDRQQQQQQQQARTTPVLQDAAGVGGVQGLNWYVKSLQLDADGDAAHSFYQEQASSDLLQQVPGRPQGRHQHCRLQGVQKGQVVLGRVS